MHDAEGIFRNGMFKKAYASRRCLIPMTASSNGGTGEPFALAGSWEKWRDPQTGEDIRTFCVVTCQTR